MPEKNVICVVVDRLHAGMVGAYGNSWARTPAIDRLASESFLFDQAFVDGTRLDWLYRAYWLGLHAAVVRQQTEADSSLPRLVAAAGMHTALVTDESAIAALPCSADFAERVFVEPTPDASTAEAASETALARVFAAASAWLEAPPKPFLLWVHARGMAAPWDAPLELRNQFAEEDDPQPPTFSSVPDYWLPEKADPDEVLGIRHAYGGQVALLDQCLDAFCEQLEESGLAEDTQLTLLSARGFPLGEHLRVGPCDAALYNETAQLVWLMRFPDGLGSMARSQALVQPPDLPGTLLEWLGLDRGPLASGQAASLLGIVEDKADSLRQAALLVSLHDCAIRTAAWHLRQPHTGTAELYAKPGDRWEVNEVARLASDLASELHAVLAEMVRAEGRSPLPSLPQALVEVVD